jgi:hypothetical protein
MVHHTILKPAKSIFVPGFSFCPHYQYRNFYERALVYVVFGPLPSLLLLGSGQANWNMAWEA